jgi:hypothetical protein
MFFKSIKITLQIDGAPIDVVVVVTCTPSTSKTELIRRAGNIFRGAASSATYEVL